MDLHQRLRTPIDVPALAAWLDALAPDERARAAQDMTAREQADLFDAVQGLRSITVDDFVPPDLAPLQRVDHIGRNSMAPGFRLFEKRFCRPDDPESAARNELWGYNHQRFSGLTGPGYFVAYNRPDGEVLIDYTRIPPHGVPGWPALLPNTARLGRFIYNGTSDTMRGVSRHVTIGRAARPTTGWMDNWFVLCRVDAGEKPGA